jgi:hypothetical protein
MREFFKGWRRKAGCVALVMACLSATGLVRSCIATDCVELQTEQRFFGVCSCRAYLIFVTCNETRDNQPFVNWEIGGIEPIEHDDSSGSMIYTWVTPHRTPNECLLIPYWSLVLPLTLLSAYLILWKPRKSS